MTDWRMSDRAPLYALIIVAVVAVAVIGLAVLIFK